MSERRTMRMKTRHLPVRSFIMRNKSTPQETKLLLAVTWLAWLPLEESLLESSQRETLQIEVTARKKESLLERSQLKR